MGTPLDLTVPPVLVAASAAAAQWLLTGRRRRRTPLGGSVTGLLAAAGLAVGVRGIADFRRARTTIHPQHPERATTLVTDGIYARTRNPMYGAMGLGLLGLAALSGRAIAVLPVAGYVAWLDRFQVQPEERALSELFGAAYADYRDRVRRWV